MNFVNLIYGIILKMEMKNCKIIENRKLEREHFLLRIENKFIKDFKPGQFIMIKIPPYFLRRPFSLCKIDKNSITVLYKVVGEGTKRLSEMTPGTVLNVLGPCGNGFKVDKNTKNIWIVGGGVGVAPLIYLTEKLKKKKITFFYGTKKKNFLFFELLPYGPEYIFATDDGSYGYKGTIFSILKNIIKKEGKPDIIYCGGPEILLKKLSEFSKKRKIPAYMTLENIMGCGMGLCYGCVIKVKTPDGWDYKRVCKDGPVFKSEEIIWE